MQQLNEVKMWRSPSFLKEPCRYAPTHTSLQSLHAFVMSILNCVLYIMGTSDATHNFGCRIEWRNVSSISNRKP